MNGGSACAYHKVREAPLPVAVDFRFIRFIPLPATAATAVYVPRSATYLLFRFLYLSINSSWLFLFPFLTGREWMAVARRRKSHIKHMTRFVKPFLAFLLTCYLVPAYQ